MRINLSITLFFIIILTLISGCDKKSTQTTFIPTIIEPEPEPEVYKSIHVNSSILNNQKAPKIALANNGNFLVLWKSQDGIEEGNYNIYAQLFNGQGYKIGGEFRVNNEANSKIAHDETQLNYDITANNFGNFVVVYSTDGATSGANVFVQYYNDEDASPVMSLEANQGDMEQIAPSVAIDSNNHSDVIITYQSQTDGLQGHKYSLYSASFELLYTNWIDTKTQNHSLDIALNDDKTFISGWHTSSLTDHVYMAKISEDGKKLSSFKAPNKTNSNNVQVDIGYNGTVLWLYKLKVDTHWVVAGKLFNNTMQESKDFIDREAKCDFGEDFTAVLDNNNSLYIVHSLSSYANATNQNADNSDLYYRLYNHTEEIKLVMNYGLINIEKLYDQKLPAITVNSTGVVATWQNSAEDNKNSDGIYAGILSNL